MYVCVCVGGRWAGKCIYIQVLLLFWCNLLTCVNCYLGTSKISLILFIETA